MFMKKIILILLINAALLAGCQTRPPNMHQLHTQSERTPSSKPVILLMADSIMDKPLQEAIRNGQAPAFEFLITHGRYYPDVVSSFPTMSVTVDSTLLTGTHPDQHRIPGLVWFNAGEQRVINYGTGLREVIKQGPNQVLTDSLLHLNNRHLNPDIRTIHEQLADHGKESASINALIYRGNTKHKLVLPESVASLSPLPSELETQGPKLLSLGVLSQHNPANQWNTFVWQSYGINNKFSAEELKMMIKENRLTDLNVVYFPDNDLIVHRKGPETLKGIREMDQQLQEILNAYGSWEESLKQAIWIVMGDSGQAVIGADRNKSVIPLKERLGAYRIADQNPPAAGQDQMVLCVNERMAYVYLLTPDLSFEDVAEQLRQDDRMDVIAWKENDGVRVRAGGSEKTLHYNVNGTYVDTYNQKWSLQGDHDLLDITVSEGDNKIQYGSYPDALQRLYSSLNSHEGRYLVITAKPGYEFIGDGSPTHVGGGGHGSLHKDDSLVPLIVTGTDLLPHSLRLVDMKPWLLQLLNVKND